MQMQYLFNSGGHHIANFVNDELYAPTGHNIGHYRLQEGIFIDLHGRYLGEIVRRDRLLYNLTSRYRSTTFSASATHSSAGAYSNPGNQSTIGNLTGFEDIPPSRLRP